MTARRWTVALAALAALSAGCGASPPDYQSIWTSGSTTSSATGTTEPAEKPIPFPDYLGQLGVSGQLVAPADLTDLTVSIPTPAGWSKSTNRHYSPEAVAITKGDEYPIAILLVMALTGDFDAAEAVSHADADARLNENFTELNSSTADFAGFPASMIEGSYDHLGTRLHSYNRIVLPLGSSGRRYLVQLTVTSLAEETVAHSDDIEAIIRGFTVAAK